MIRSLIFLHNTNSTFSSFQHPRNLPVTCCLSSDITLHAVQQQFSVEDGGWIPSSSALQWKHRDHFKEFLEVLYFQHGAAESAQKGLLHQQGVLSFYQVLLQSHQIAAFGISISPHSLALCSLRQSQYKPVTHLTIMKTILQNVPLYLLTEKKTHGLLFMKDHMSWLRSGFSRSLNGMSN